MTNNASSKPNQTQNLPWWYVLLEGIASIVLGVMLMRSPQVTLEIFARLFGYYWLAVGILSLLVLPTKYGAGRRGSLAIRGVLGIITAILVLNMHIFSQDFWAPLIILFIGVQGLIIGVVGILQAIKGGGWGAAILGLLSIGFAALVFGGSLGFIGDILWLVGLLTVIGGVASILLSLRLRNHPEEGSLGVDSIRNPTVGIWRALLLIVVALAAVVVTFIAWILPIKHKGVGIHYWMTTLVSRVINKIFGLEVICADEEALLAHEGLVFVNHVSYLDIPVIISVVPMRFLSTAEVYKVPLVGWMADSVATVFVDRQDKDSRHSVRDSIARSVANQPFPPFVVFPEGHFGTPTSLAPFHYGSFAIAVENEFPFLPVALRYDRPDVATWRGVKEEPFIASFWRMLTHRGKIRAELFPLEPVHPTADGDPAELAHATQRAVEDALGLEPAPTTIDHTGE